MRKLLVSVLVVAAVAAPASLARPASAVNVCKLVNAKQLASLGVSSSCRQTTIPGAGATHVTGNWGRVNVDPAALTLSVATYASRSGTVWQLGLKYLKVVPGTPKKVSGIGSQAYESGGDGGTLASINFVVGNHIVSMSWRTKTPPRTLTAFNAVAKSIAAEL